MTRSIGKRTVVLLGGAMVLLFGLAVPAQAGTTSSSTHHRARAVAAPAVTYRTVTKKDGTRERLITAVRGKELVDARGRPAPVSAPEPDATVHPLTEPTTCEPGHPVNLTHDGDQHACYWKTGTRVLQINRISHLTGGRWYGALYYETATQCVANPFSAYESRRVDPNIHHCLLEIDRAD